MFCSLRLAFTRADAGGTCSSYRARLVVNNCPAQTGDRLIDLRARVPFEQCLQSPVAQGMLALYTVGMRIAGARAAPAKCSLGIPRNLRVIRAVPRVQPRQVQRSAAKLLAPRTSPSGEFLFRASRQLKYFLILMRLGRRRLGR